MAKPNKKPANQKLCEMTMSDNGAFNGVEHYWQCGKPAKFKISNRPSPGMKLVCGIHANAERKIAMRLGFPLPIPL